MTDLDDATDSRRVDPFRFAPPLLRKLISDQVPEQPTYTDIPWAEPKTPLARAKVAMLTTAGISMKGDPPFDMDRERREPLWGDPSWRRIPAIATPEDVEVNHLHIKTDYIARDLNVALPLDRLRELVKQGVVGAVAESHYSVMGYQGSDAARIADTSGAAIAESLRAEGVDLLLLAPV